MYEVFFPDENVEVEGQNPLQYETRQINRADNYVRPKDNLAQLSWPERTLDPYGTISRTTMLRQQQDTPTKS